MRVLAVVIAALLNVACASSDALPQPDAGAEPRDSDLQDALNLDATSRVDSGFDAEDAEDAFPPVDVPAQVRCGYRHTCVLSTFGNVRCWGENSVGELGDGSTTKKLRPSSVAISGAVDVLAGNGQTCAVTSAGVSCWGEGAPGILGDGVLPGPLSMVGPRPVLAPSDVVVVGGGGKFLCGIGMDRRVRCWGANWYRDGAALLTEDAQDCGGPYAGLSCLSRPTILPGIADVAEIAFGNQFGCARTQASHEAFCWGSNDMGQLGDGTTERSVEPKFISGLPAVRRLFAGDSGACALTDGGLYCWGEERDEANIPLPGTTKKLVTGFAAPVQEVHFDRGYRCALLTDGRVQSRRRNRNVPGGFSAKPIDIPGLKRARSLCGWGGHSCIVSIDNEVWCWGDPFLGDDSDGVSTTPVKVKW